MSVLDLSLKDKCLIVSRNSKNHKFPEFQLIFSMF